MRGGRARTFRGWARAASLSPKREVHNSTPPPPLFPTTFTITISPLSLPLSPSTCTLHSSPTPTTTRFLCSLVVVQQAFRILDSGRGVNRLAGLHFI